MTVLVTAAISSLGGTTNAQAAVAAAPVGSTASAAYVNRIVALVNAQRSAHGLRALAVSPCATRFAAPWTTHMAATNTLGSGPLALVGGTLTAHGGCVRSRRRCR